MWFFNEKETMPEPPVYRHQVKIYHPDSTWIAVYLPDTDGVLEVLQRFAQWYEGGSDSKVLAHGDVAIGVTRAYIKAYTVTKVEFD